MLSPILISELVSMKHEIIYSQPETNGNLSELPKIEGVTGVILAGGASSRMGRNKALLEINGTSIITLTFRTLASLFHEVIVVTNSPLDYDFLPCRIVPDIYPGYGSIAGLHSALTHSSNSYSFVTACDLPFIDQAIIRYLCDFRTEEYDAVVPLSGGGQEPLHALYASSCKDLFEDAIQHGERKIQDVLKRMNIRQVTCYELKGFGGRKSSFLNVNTPEEYEAIR